MIKKSNALEKELVQMYQKMEAKDKSKRLLIKLCRSYGFKSNFLSNNKKNSKDTSRTR